MSLEKQIADFQSELSELVGKHLKAGVPAIAVLSELSSVQFELQSMWLTIKRAHQAQEMSKSIVTANTLPPPPPRNGLS